MSVRPLLLAGAATVAVAIGLGVALVRNTGPATSPAGSATSAAAYIQRYRIQLMPTQVFFDAQGQETGRNIGMISAADIVARLQGGGS